MSYEVERIRSKAKSPRKFSFKNNDRTRKLGKRKQFQSNHKFHPEYP